MDLRGTPALENFQAMLATLPESDALYFPLLQLVANSAFNSFQKTGSIDELNHAIEALERMISSIIAPVQRATALKTLASWLYTRYENTGQSVDLKRAADRAAAATELIREVEPERREPFLFILYSMLWARGMALTSVKDLENALEVVGELRDISECQELLSSAEVEIGEQLYRARFQVFGSIEDLNKAIASFERRLDSCPNRLELASELSVCLCQRGAYNKSIADLDRAVQLAEEVTHSDNVENKVLHLDRLGITLLNRFRRAGSMRDLDRAIQTADAAVEAARAHPSHIYLSNSLHNLGLALFARVEETKSEEDLDKAMECGNELVQMKSAEHSRHLYLKFLGDVLTLKYSMTESLEYLDRAIELFETALDNSDKSRVVNRCEQLLSFGRALQKRFERTAVANDINKSITNLEEALRIKPPDSPSRRYLQVIASAYSCRYLRFRAKEDLDCAIEMQQAALDEFPANHPERSIHLHNLSSLLLTRFNRRESFVANDLNQAIESSQEAINLITRTSDEPGYLSTLAALFKIRFERVSGSIDDLEHAVRIYQDAISKAHSDDLDLPSLFHNLAITMTQKYEQTKNPDDLNKAIEIAQSAVNSIGEAHPDRGLYLNNLGRILLVSFRSSNNKDDLDKAYLAKKEALHLATASPYIRVTGCLAIVWALAESQKDFSRAVELIERAIRLFTRITPRIQTRRDQEYNISEFSGLPGTAASVLLAAGRKPVEVLEILEIGRGVIANLQLELRSDITELESVNSDEARTLAARFKTLREQLDNNRAVGGFPETRDLKAAIRIKSLERNELDSEFNETLTKIRRLSGFDRFLLGPTESELKGLVGTGSIVAFNGSPVRCDAIIITFDDIRLYPLPSLQYSQLKTKTTEFAKLISESSSIRTYDQSKRGVRKILEWLWDVAVGPVLDFMGIVGSPSGAWPKVCWMGVDSFSTLPLHAAGYHGNGSTKNVLDRVVSTYTTTIKSLAYSGTQLRKTGTQAARALFVSMPTTPGMPNGDLKHADQEVKEASSILPLSIDHSILERPSKKDVLEGIQRSDLVHFACHGVLDPMQPSHSHLRLQDWQTSPLSVADLAALRLTIPRIAYLSACFAAENRAEGLSDEGLNLAGACQLAGFPTVVGTLWRVNDEYSGKVAQMFYTGLVENAVINIDKASEALHWAVRKVRDETRKVPRMSRVEPDDPIIWGPYILMGV